MLSCKESIFAFLPRKQAPKTEKINILMEILCKHHQRSYNSQTRLRRNQFT